MKVVRAVPEDARSVAEIQVRAWRTAYASILPDDFLANLSVERSEAMWTQCIASGVPELLVARSDELMKGWLAFGASRDSDAVPATVELWAINVAPEAWATGAGRLLWLEAKRLMQQRAAQSCSLWVFPQNARAIRFYETAGFVHDAAAVKNSTFGAKLVPQVRYVADLSTVRL